MSASKKTTKSSTPAPASKPAVAAKKSAAATTVRATAKTPVAMLAPSPAPVAVAKSSPAVTAQKPVKTTITARVDVGFGNALFLRGEGPGLSWEKGLAMSNVGSDLWQVTLEQSVRSYAFKFLVNDTTWSAGPDFTAACGTSVTLTPQF